MLIQFNYENSPDFQISEVSVVGTFNQFDPISGRMTKNRNVWELEVDLPPGEHLYRFLFNGIFEMNDPAANLYMPDAADKLWSMVIINDNHERLYNPNETFVCVSDYSMFNRVLDELPAVSKKQFNLALDKEVAICFDYTDIQGINTITILWHDPIGKVVAIDEKALFRDLEDTEEIYRCWHTMPFNVIDEPLMTGNWHFKLFINGQYILEDYFEIQRGTSYSSAGRLRSF